MASVSSLGIGSNLDLNGLLSSIESAEQAPLKAIQKQQSSYTAKLTAYGQLQGALTSLQTAATALSKPELFQGIKATPSAADVLSASASAGAASGSYAINVTQLAQAQSLAASGVASSSANLASGTAPTTLMIDFGTISGGTLGTDGHYTGASFTPTVLLDPPAPPNLPTPTAANSITIDPAKSSLADIRDAINGNAELGVTAAIVNDGSATPYRLVLTAKQTGAASSMRLTVTGDAALQSLLAHDPGSATQLQQTQAAQNAQLTVNGIAVTSATSSVVDAVPGVTMTLSKVGASTLSVQNDTASVQAAVTTFVSAYNTLQNLATKLTAYDSSSNSAATLLGDSVLRNIQVGLRSALTAAQSDDGSGLTMLSQIGVAFQKDGTLATDSTKLTAALTGKLAGMAHLFAGSAGVGGYGTQLAARIGTYIGTDGSLAAATKGVNTTLDTLSKQYNATSDRIDATVARYKAQFTQLDLMMSQMTATSTYLTQQFEALNNTSSKN